MAHITQEYPWGILKAQSQTFFVPFVSLTDRLFPKYNYKNSISPAELSRIRPYQLILHPVQFPLLAPERLVTLGLFRSGSS